jgi:iron-sulfur cluster assembly accessory protein
MENESALLIDMTETATSKIKEVLEEQEINNSYLRIQMTSNEHGAPGYAFGLEEKPSQDDTVVDLGDFKALIDPGTLPLISGSNIDYVEGLHRSGFIITNPNIPTGGGCGGGGCGGGGGGCGCGGGGCGCGCGN